MQGEVFEAFRSIDIPEDKALKAAAALATRDKDVEALKADVQLLKWMVGTSIGLTLLLLGSAFALWSKLGEIAGQVAQIARTAH